MHKGGPFNKRWIAGSIQKTETEKLAQQLESEGARQYTLDAATKMTSIALDALNQAQPRGEAGEALRDLSNRLLQRNV